MDGFSHAGLAVPIQTAEPLIPPRGERRIHKKPNATEITACRPWLDAEIAFVKPRAIVCLGSTAAQAVVGPKFRVTLQRGIFVPSELAEYVTATVHPSSILRAALGTSM